MEGASFFQVGHLLFYASVITLCPARFSRIFPTVFENSIYFQAIFAVSSSPESFGQNPFEPACQISTIGQKGAERIASLQPGPLKVPAPYGSRSFLVRNPMPSLLRIMLPVPKIHSHHRPAPHRPAPLHHNENYRYLQKARSLFHMEECLSYSEVTEHHRTMNGCQHGKTLMSQHHCPENLMSQNHPLCKRGSTKTPPSHATTLNTQFHDHTMCVMSL